MEPLPRRRSDAAASSLCGRANLANPEMFLRSRRPGRAVSPISGCLWNLFSWLLGQPLAQLSAATATSTLPSRSPSGASQFPCRLPRSAVAPLPSPRLSDTSPSASRSPESSRRSPPPASARPQEPGYLDRSRHLPQVPARRFRLPTELRGVLRWPRVPPSQLRLRLQAHPRWTLPALARLVARDLELGVPNSAAALRASLAPLPHEALLPLLALWHSPWQPSQLASLGQPWPRPLPRSRPAARLRPPPASGSAQLELACAASPRGYLHGPPGHSRAARPCIVSPPHPTSAPLETAGSPVDSASSLQPPSQKCLSPTREYPSKASSKVLVTCAEDPTIRWPCSPARRSPVGRRCSAPVA
mmetsp:Transcript_62086/g.147953  ORF Transcript_62086/g.147953 Transcript_62086/m.147953 type:complete len:359 (-) Transcript_62086:1564-2640(-)